MSSLQRANVSLLCCGIREDCLSESTIRPRYSKEVVGASTDFFIPVVSPSSIRRDRTTYRAAFAASSLKALGRSWDSLDHGPVAVMISPFNRSSMNKEQGIPWDLRNPAAAKPILWWLKGEISTLTEASCTPTAVSLMRNLHMPENHPLPSRDRSRTYRRTSW